MSRQLLQDSYQNMVELPERAVGSLDNDTVITPSACHDHSERGTVCGILRMLTY